MKKNYLLRLFSGLFVVLSLAGQVTKAQYVEFVQITDDANVQTLPAIDGNYIVWEDYRNGPHADIYLYNRSDGTEMPLASDIAVASTNPAISGNRVVWSEKGEIYIYDISTPQIDPHPLLVWAGTEKSLAIHGDVLVGSHTAITEPRTWNIFMYDFTTGQLTYLTDDDNGDQENPDVYGDYVVWQDKRSGNWDIYMYHIPTGTETQLTDDPADQTEPAIYGKRVVWQDTRNGDYDIYMHHITFGLGTVFENFDWPLWNLGQYSRDDQMHPDIYGDHVVWQDDRHGDWELYLFTFINDIAGNFSRMFEVEHNQTLPGIYDKYVVFKDGRDYDGGSDIWQWEIPPGCDLALVAEDEPDPVTTGNELVYTIYVRNTGEQAANDVLLTCTLPAGVDYLYTHNSSGSGATRVGNEVYCDLGTMAYNDMDTIMVHVTPLAEGRPVFSAMVETSDDDVNPDNNVQSITTNVVWALSDVIDIGINPDLDMRNGVSHMVYIDKMEGDYLKYATNKTGVWTRSTIYENHNDPIMDSHIAVDNQDTVHVVYFMYNNWTTTELYYVKQTQTGWTTPLKLAESDSEFGGISIDCSPSGIIYVSYLTTIWRDKIHLRYFDGTWSEPVIVPTPGTDPQGNVYGDLSMSVDGDGHLHFAYYLMGTPDQGPHYITNAPDSVWKASELIHENWGGGQLETLQLSIATDAGNRPHISYSAAHEGDFEENYMYAVKTAGSWTIDYVYDQHISDFSAIATDPDQDPHICFRADKTGKLLYSFLNGSDWIHKVISNDGNNINGIKTDDEGYVHIAFSEYNSTYQKNVVKYLTSKPEPPRPQISVSPDSLDFWKRVVGNITDPRVVTVRNYGEAGLVLSDVSIDFIHEQDFFITANPCTTIPANGKCDISVAFDPQSIGNKTEYLRIESNDPVNPVVRIKLKGEGLEPIVNVDGNGLFGEVAVGSSVAHPYEILNVGNTDLRVDLVVIQDDDADQFSFDGLPGGGFYISPGESQTFNVYFSPTSEGEKTTRLLIYTSDLDFQNIYLTGTGIIPSWSVAGTVKAPDNSPVTEGLVTIYELSPGGEIDQLLWKPLEGSADFVFNGVRQGDITLNILPDRDVYPHLMLGYYGNAETLDDAEIIHHDHDLTGLELYALNAPGNAGGSSVVEGVLESEENPSPSPAGLKTVIDGYVEGAAVYLYDQQDNIVAYDVTGRNGEFGFENLPVGTFTFFVDYMGVPMADPALVEQVVIDTDGQELFVNARIENGVIIAEVSEVTGISDADGPAGFKVYPNPARSVLHIESPDFKTRAVVEIMDAGGRVVWNKTMKANPDGLTVAIPVHHLKNGIYLLQVSGSGKSHRTKIVIGK